MPLDCFEGYVSGSLAYFSIRTKTAALEKAARRVAVPGGKDCASTRGGWGTY